MRNRPIHHLDRFVAILFMTILGGCEVGPNYKVPPQAQINARDVQGTFVGARNNRDVQDGPLPTGWWHLYQSKDLDGLVAAGFVANTNLRVAEANLQRSHAMTRVAEAKGEPQLGFEGGYERALLSAESYLSPEENLPPVNIYDVSLSASYEVDLFGRIRRGIEAAKADEEAVEAARDWVRVNVAANITRYYLQVCSDGEDLAVARHSVELQQKSLEFTQRLQQEGRGTRLDVTRSQALVDHLESIIPTIEARRRNALFQLAILTGNPPSDLNDNLTRCVSAPPILDPIPVGDGTTLLKRRPDVRAAERQLAAANAKIGVATADLYPRIILKASIGSTGLTRDFLNHSTNEWAVGPFVSWQLNQSTVRAKISVANAAEKAQLARFDGTVLGALRDVETALNNYHQDLASENRLIAARDEAAKATADAQELQDSGRSTALATLDAERTLASSERALADMRSRISQDQVALFFALGGGWETEAMEVKQSEMPAGSN